MYYKLTDANGCTHSSMQWGKGVTHKADGKSGQRLCTDGWIHYYESPYVAVLHNPAGADFPNPRLWEFDPKGKTLRDGLKCGCRKGTTVREIALPEFTTVQKVAFAIYCALEVYDDPAFRGWARRWINDTDRSSAAAWAARAARAAWAAEAAARAAGAAEAAAWAEKTAARTAAWAAEAAARAAGEGKEIDFSALAEKAHNFERAATGEKC